MIAIVTVELMPVKPSTIHPKSSSLCSASSVFHTVTVCHSTTWLSPLDFRRIRKTSNLAFLSALLRWRIYRETSSLAREDWFWDVPYCRCAFTWEINPGGKQRESCWTTTVTLPPFCLGSQSRSRCC